METTWGKVMEHEDLIDIIARVVYRKNPTQGLSLEDYRSMAFEAAFIATQEYDPKRVTVPFKVYLRTKTEFRLRDKLRQHWARDGWSRRGVLAVTGLYGESVWRRFEEDNYSEDEYDDYTIDLLRNTGFDYREKVIVAMLSMDATKVEIAQQLGVDSSRVSQLLRGIRDKMTARKLCESALDSESMAG